MRGIYLIRNTVNDKLYIGQSIDIKKRWTQHKSDSKRCKPNSPIIHKALNKYGIELFEFSVLKICNEDESLDEWEIYYILLYNTLIPNGYNMTPGGDSLNIHYGEDNSNAKVNELIVYEIRELFKTDITKSEAYDKYRDIISMNTFADIWTGKTWKNIHYDVYTDENKHKHKHQKGRNHCATFTKEEVLFIRDCKAKGMVKSVVRKMYFPNSNINTFSDVWYNNSFPNIQSNLPQQELDKQLAYYLRSGINNVNLILSENVVKDILIRKFNGESRKSVMSDYPDIKLGTFKGVWNNRTYKEIYKQISNDYSR